jgi:hypothetical protein
LVCEVIEDANGAMKLVEDAVTAHDASTLSMPPNDAKARAIYIRDVLSHAKLFQCWLGHDDLMPFEMAPPAAPEAPTAAASVTAPVAVTATQPPGVDDASMPKKAAAATAAAPVSPISPLNAAFARAKVTELAGAVAAESARAVLSAANDAAAASNAVVATAAVVAVTPAATAIMVPKLSVASPEMWIMLQKRANHDDLNADNSAVVQIQMAAFQAKVKTIKLPNFSSSLKDIEHFVSLPSMYSISENVLDAELDHADLAVFRHEWTKKQKWTATFTRDLKGAAGALKSHLELLEKAAIRKTLAVKLQTEKDAMKKQRDDSRAVAKELIDEAQKVVPLPTVYAAIVDSKPTPIARITPDDLTPASFETPFILTTGDAIKAWAGNPVAQGVMAKWPGTYKKEASYIERKQYSGLLYPKGGGSDAEDMFNSILTPLNGSILDMKDISKNWGSTCWTFAYGVGFHSEGVAPTCAGMLRYLQMGEMQVHAFDPLSVTSSFDASSLEGLKNSLLPATVDSLQASGVQIHSSRFGKNEMLYIPAAWVILETCTKGPLCFGVRKSVFVDNARGKCSYGKILAMMQKDKRDVSKMEIILKKFA